MKLLKNKKKLIKCISEKKALHVLGNASGI